jgi:type I restriction enzyme R subunit
VFDHVSTAYSDDGTSAYDVEPAPAGVGGRPREVSVDSITAAVVERIRRDADFAALVALQLRGQGATFALTIDEVIANDEDAVLEFKSTARWDIREGRRNPVIEDAIVEDNGRVPQHRRRDALDSASDPTERSRGSLPDRGHRA